MSKRVKEIVKKLTAMDDIFFYKLARDKDFCEEMIQVILQNDKIHLLECTPQYALKNIKGRSVILDLKCVDEKNRIINVEVQKKDNDDHQKRVRYNIANIDTAESEKGIRFEELNDVYVIYISKFDVFGKGKTIYHVRRVLEETRDIVENGTHEIYVNTKIDDGTEIAKYMQLLSSEVVAAEGNFSRSRKAIRGIKIGEEDETMCDLVEEYAKEYAKEHAKEYAKEYADEQKIKLMVECYLAGGISLDLILQKLDLTQKQFMEYVKKYQEQENI